MSNLLSTPVIDHPMEEMRRKMRTFDLYRTDGELDLTPSYQRESVWTTEQRQAMWYSLLSGIPIGAIYINMRSDFYADPRYRVVDGKQRIEAYLAFLDNELELPKLWFAPRRVSGGESLSEEVPEGAPEMVRFADLTENGRKYAQNHPSCLLIETKLEGEADEALFFGLVNGGGTAQTPESMANAARVAGGKDHLTAKRPGLA
jgi:hypothetical protein